MTTSVLPAGWTTVRGAALSGLPVPVPADIPNVLFVPVLAMAVHFDEAVHARLRAEQAELARLWDHEDSAADLLDVRDFLLGQGMGRLAEVVRVSIDRHLEECRGKNLPEERPRFDPGFLTLFGEDRVAMLQCPGDCVPRRPLPPVPEGFPALEKAKTASLDGKPIPIHSWEWTGPPGLVRSLVLETEQGEVEWSIASN